jgi:hypothetical protein
VIDKTDKPDESNTKEPVILQPTASGNNVVIEIQENQTVGTKHNISDSESEEFEEA